jgi:hypothetical protein
LAAGSGRRVASETGEEAAVSEVLAAAPAPDGGEGRNVRVPAGKRSASAARMSGWTYASS